MGNLIIAIALLAQLAGPAALPGVDINHNLKINYIENGIVKQITLDEFNKLPSDDKLKYFNTVESILNQA